MQTHSDIRSKRERYEDEYWMRMALDEAKRGEGGTRPNPPVGCVIVKNGVPIVSAYHAFAGGAHAEAAAIEAAAGWDLSDATLYVTLEPCSTQGRTPPCTRAILRSGIQRVVAACEDPNPIHAGRGFNELWEARVDVVTGVCRAEAQTMLAPFFKLVSQSRPYVTLKMAQSLDGGIADHAGQSKWITGPASRDQVKALRRKSDIVLVGAGTVIADNPSLLRDEEPMDGGLPGMRGVVDASGSVSLDAKIFTDGHAGQTIYFTTEACSSERCRQISETGAHVVILPFDPASGNAKEGATRPACLNTLLDFLGEEGYLRVLCESGAKLASSFVKGDLVDELLLFVAPIVLGHDSLRAFGAHPFNLMTAPRYRIESTTRCGDDLLVRALRNFGA
ncbi:MAG: bifunctional diaminohydroxyphosphoribosylaminopyrimidine deaminase/5-amino-6-(5-phosphoribosylamino)uracil reductase RibD [Kiritimatiellia bacterium]